MKYLARALAPKSAGFQPAAPFTSPLARMDQRWHLHGFAGQSASAGHVTDALSGDDGFVTVDEGLPAPGKASGAAWGVAPSADYPTAEQPAARRTELRFAADTSAVSGTMQTSNTAPTVSTAAIATAKPAAALPLVVTTLAADSDPGLEEAGHRIRESKPGVPETLKPNAVPEFVRVSRPSLPATARVENRAPSESKPGQVDMLAQVSAWLGGHGRQRFVPSLPVSPVGGSARFEPPLVGSPHRTAFAPPVVQHTTLEIGSIEIEILPSPVVPVPKPASSVPGGARAERGRTPFGGRQF